MKKLCIIYDELFLKHEADFYHAESPQRLTAILEYLDSHSSKMKFDLIKPSPAAKEHILLAHTEEHFNIVKFAVESGKGMLDPDTYINSYSFKAALLAAGSVINAADLVSRGEYENAFCLVRPPGHHAERSRAMGFCLFNNVAVGVQYALTYLNKKRIAVIDWDVHHGNGTQDIFYNTDEVLFISLHQHPLYPGTGLEFETGAGNGKGFTLNFPLPPGSSGKIYIKIFEDEILKKLEEYKPDMLFISAGFDAHMDDPLAGMNLTSNDFGILTKVLNNFAKSENIPVISVLEGGYNLNAISESVYEHLKILNT